MAAGVYCYGLAFYLSPGAVPPPPPPPDPLPVDTQAELVREVVNRQVADGALQLEIQRRYEWEPGIGILERDLSAGVQAKLNTTAPGGGSSAQVLSVGSVCLGDRHIADTAGIAETKLALAADALPCTPSRRTLGTGPRQAMPGNTPIPVLGVNVPPLVGGLVPASYLPDGSVAGAPLDTTSDPKPPGIPSAGVSVRSSPADHTHPGVALPQPADHGLIAWSLDPATAASSAGVTAGVLQLLRMWIPRTCTITGMALCAVTAGAGLTDCHTALYDGNRSLLGQSPNMATLWGATSGVKKGDLTAPISVAAGYVYAAFWLGGWTSAPGWARSGVTTNTAVTTNFNAAGAPLRFSTANTGLTATAPATASSLVAAASAFLAGLY